MKRTTRIAASEAPTPALEATLPELLARLKTQSDKIQTMTATVDLQPTAGSVYSGVIKEYHDVKGFILLKKPSQIRILGQAPVVRTNIFDMVSDGRQFRLSIPPKQKFYVGDTNLRRPAKNALENLRPQHILDALLVPSIDLAAERVVFEQEESNNHKFYVVTVIQPGSEGEYLPVRKVWFSRTDLNPTRTELYGPGGALIEDVQYSGFQDFSGVLYPSDILLRRPAEDYELTITVEKAAFNQDIPQEKFELKKPENAQLIDLNKPEADDGK